MHKLVLIRHGESEWNKENRFTGWKDVDLSEKGREEARAAGKLLKAEGFTFDEAYTSVLKRAIRTLWMILDEMDLMWIPETKSWLLNERHYGGLQGLNKAETAAQHGEKQVLIWRRSYDVLPNLLEEGDERWLGKDARYSDIEAAKFPKAEALKNTVERVVPYYETEIMPKIKSGKRLIIAAHGNSLRALVKHLDAISDEDIVHRNIPTGIPLVYELGEDLKPTKSYYLGNQEAVKAAQEAVANQGKAKNKNMSIATAYEHIILSENGVPMIEGTTTKIVEIVLETKAYGWSPEEVHFQHPYLSLGQIYSAMAYYFDHLQEFEQEIKERLEKVGSIRANIGESKVQAKLKEKGLL